LHQAEPEMTESRLAATALELNRLFLKVIPTVPYIYYYALLIQQPKKETIIRKKDAQHKKKSGKDDKYLCTHFLFLYFIIALQVRETIIIRVPLAMASSSTTPATNNPNIRSTHDHRLLDHHRPPWVYRKQFFLLFHSQQERRILMI
jgi:hypothetical protein